MAEQCVIGRGIQIKGNLSGGEDLVVEGSVEGHVSMKNHLVVMETGIITADILTSSLEVHGRVSGQIDASEMVSLSAASNVVADIRAPRVVIEDGARFRGRIEMDVDLPKDLL
jgi:cytoskeletal protein CcmA (bactofilin family)